jgi:hypothetical protein
MNVLRPRAVVAENDSRLDCTEFSLGKVLCDPTLPPFFRSTEIRRLAARSGGICANTTATDFTYSISSRFCIGQSRKNFGQNLANHGK